jgi:hypothetical protein
MTLWIGKAAGQGASRPMAGVKTASFWWFFPVSRWGLPDREGADAYRRMR